MRSARAETSLVRRRRGRPRKFGRPSNPVTVTLPDDVIARLGEIDADLGRAIVAVVEHRPGPRPRAVENAQLATYGRHAVIVVTPIKALNRLPGVQLIPIGHNRALISLDQPNAIPQLELDIRDAVDRNGVGKSEKQTLRVLADILRRARKSGRVTLEERTIIVLEAKRQRRAVS